MRPQYEHKAIHRGELIRQRVALRREGMTLAHCHGCFDIVHPGHIRHLREAASQADRLVVSLTPDRYIEKGPGRPMFDQNLRAEQLAALSFVDWVLINDRPTAEALLEELAPDVYVKGAEYAINDDPRFERERSIVERHGGSVVFSGDEVVYSSTAIIEAIDPLVEPIGHGSGLAHLAVRHDLCTGTLSGILDRSKGKRVLVLSESMIDVYAHCSTPEVAQEHPMLSLCPDREEQFDGGGAVISLHLAGLGLEPTLCTPIGRDPESLAMIERLKAQGVRVEAIETDRALPRKLRYLVDGEKMMKIDSSVRYQLAGSTADNIIAHINDTGGYDATVIADFGLGLFAECLASRVIAAARGRVGMILGDVSGRRAQLGEMRGADVLCPCEVELRQMLGADRESITELALRAMQITGVGTLCVTRAGEGMQIYAQGTGMRALPALCRNPVDVLGCGDALLSVMSAALLGGADMIQAAYMGSLAAAVEGETRGNLPVTTQAVLGRAQQLAAQLALGQAGVSELSRPEPMSTPVSAPIR